MRPPALVAVLWLGLLTPGCIPDVPPVTEMWQDLRDLRLRWDQMRLRPEAEQGNADGQYLLALSYLQQGRTADAVKWFRMAAAQGHAEAQFRLGKLAYYRETPDEPRGWLCVAANQRHAGAMLELGSWNEAGFMRQMDHSRAYMWYSLAASNGHESAAALKDQLAKKMTPDQVAEAERLVKEWKPGPCKLKSAKVSN
ncbi:MAG: tetratricopeptide repeat protein [Nitrospinota bacterium]